MAHFSKNDEMGGMVEVVQRCCPGREGAVGAYHRMSPIIAAAKAYCTEGEICDVFRDVFGRHQDRPEF